LASPATLADRPASPSPRPEPAPVRPSWSDGEAVRPRAAYNISNLDGTIQLGGSCSLSDREIDFASQATDRSTICPTPAGRSQSASAPALRFAWTHQFEPQRLGLKLRRNRVALASPLRPELFCSTKRIPADFADSARATPATRRRRGLRSCVCVLLRSTTANDVNRGHGNSKPRALLLESAVGLGTRWTKRLLFVFQSWTWSCQIPSMKNV
jgi:hypothetical protein